MRDPLERDTGGLQGAQFQWQNQLSESGKSVSTRRTAAKSYCWFVNPVEHTLEVLRLREGAWTIVIVGSEPVRVRPHTGTPAANL